MAFACLAYLPVLLHGRFLCDDFILLSRIKNGLGIWDFQGSDFYRPAISTVLSMLWKVFGNNPFPYYALNVLMLVGTGLAVHGTWFSIRKRQKEAFVVGLAFVLWITHSETVSWISGMTDGVSVFFASIGLYRYVYYRKQPTLLGFAAVLFCLWLGLLGKEAIITWMPILLVVGFGLEPQKGSLLLKEAAILAGLTIAFVTWRTHVIGKLIAGYGNATHLDLSVSDLSIKLARHLCNAFLPCNKWITLWSNSTVTILIMAVICVGTLALLLRKWPKKVRSPQAVQIVWTVMTLFGVLRAVELIVPAEKFHVYGARLTVACLLFVGLAVFNLIRYRGRISLDNPWAFGGVSLLMVILYAFTRNLEEGLLLLGIYLWFTLETRPMSQPSAEDRQLIHLGLAFFAATFLAILPMLTLAVEANGEASRFSYGPSLFSTMLMACVLLLYAKSLPRLSIAAPCVLGASGFLLFINNIPWAQASNLSQATTKAIQSVLPARRIYVLSAPGAISAAYLFRIGLEHLAEVSLGDHKVEVHTAQYQIRTISGDNLAVRRFDEDTFGLEVFNDEKPRRFEDSYLQAADPDMTDGWFTFPNANALVAHNVELPQLRLVHLEDFQPDTDHIIIVDGVNVRVIQ